MECLQAEHCLALCSVVGKTKSESFSLVLFIISTSASSIRSSLPWTCGSTTRLRGSPARAWL